MTFLEEILRRKRVEVETRRLARPDAELERQSAHPAHPEQSVHPERSVREANAASKGQQLFNALSPRGGPMQVIAEVKRASPSVGEIDGGLDPGRLAKLYAEAGAAAISVLTDGPGFGGSLEDLAVVRSAVKVPILRKDFIIDRYQLLEAAAAGADAVLLIVAALPTDRLLALMEASEALGLSTLIEVHDEQELDCALRCEARVIGVNNRNLKTFEVDLAVSERLLANIPDNVRCIAESGVKGPAEAQRLRAAGAANLLVGEALVRAANPAQLLTALRST